MTTVLLEPQTMTMTNPKTPDTQSVKLKLDVIQSARIVASCRGVSITDLLSDMIRPIVSKMERGEMQKRLKISEPAHEPFSWPDLVHRVAQGKWGAGRMMWSECLIARNGMGTHLVSIIE